MIPGVKWTKKQVQEAQAKERDAKNMFQLAGEEFVSLRLPKYAARCFASAGDFEKAAKLFESRECYEEAARCYSSAELWTRASHCYAKLDKFQEAVECLEKGNYWNELLETLSSFRKRVPEDKFEEYIKKYIPLLVENLVKPQVCKESRNSQQSIKTHNRDLSVQSQARENWQTMMYIISIVAPEIESKLLKANSKSRTSSLQEAPLLIHASSFSSNPIN